MEPDLVPSHDRVSNDPYELLRAGGFCIDNITNLSPAYREPSYVSTIQLASYVGSGMPDPFTEYPIFAPSALFTWIPRYNIIIHSGQYFYDHKNIIKYLLIR